MASRILANAGAVLRACFIACFSTTALFYTTPAAARTNVLCPLDGDGQPGAVISFVSAGPASANLCELSKAKTPERAPTILAATAVSFSAPDRALARPTPKSEVGEPPASSRNGTGSMLASVFGAIAIRDNKGGATEIRFEGTPPEDLRLTDVQGRLLPATWRGNILSLPPVSRFTLSGFSQAVDVARVQSIEYQFPASNLTGLERVFDEDDATYLAFEGPKGGVSVLGDGHSIGGMLKGRYYKLNGRARQLSVIADGEVVHVDRIARVRFYERPGTVRP
ncbi:hypothetical protein GJQ57_23730 [Ralstonia pickettii]|uniref:Uncharacterized protein n=1 Tax=Ralstonia pickettii TaxID=329 RepID=A0A7X2LDC3_RALPI|nr:hypothetical protein [Ralstonia pickettii]MRT01661.1 hypothetical protein [Ralstonia pickettii]